MKKILVALLALSLPIASMADSYTSLWKQYKAAQRKDHPKTEINILTEILNKAESEKAYGQMLKAQLLRSSAKCSISQDSTDVELERLEQKATKTTDKVEKAVYASVLGKLYSDGDEQSKVKSKKWYVVSMENPALLAQHKSNEFSPAAVSGIDSRIFYDDLLHVVGIQAGAYKTMHDYYAKNGNRTAAAICALGYLKQSRPNYIREAKKSNYLQRVDSLIKVYSDLREAGEMAIEHYNVIAQAEDETAEDKVNFINYAISRWGTWPRMSILRNALADLQQPSFAINIGDYMMTPNAVRTLRINSIRNVDELTVNIYKVRADGNTNLNPSSKKGYERMKDLVVPGAVFSSTKRYIGQPAWKELSDTLNIKGLPVGVYMIEATTTDNKIEPQRELLRVSDVYVMHQTLPNNKLRFAVVNATTGKPIGGAHLQLTFHKSTNMKPQSLTTDRNGEVEYNYGNQRPAFVYAYTDDDRACGKFNVRSGYYYWDNGEKVDHRIEVYTDRAIYRPGQTVHVSAIKWRADKSTLSSKTEENKKVKFILRDANYKEVNSKEVMTDKFGQANADFALPQSGLTGSFTVEAHSDDVLGRSFFKVEQYKRPTFQVSFDKYDKTYKEGDTISVRGIATTYSGVPVQGAKVKYTVNRRRGLWWFINGTKTEIDNDTTVTADDGSFIIRIPMNFPEDVRRSGRLYYNFDIDAVVTDRAGETREGSYTLPLSNRPAILSADLPEKIQRDSLKTITFTCKNLSGEDVASKVNYRFDNGQWKTTITQHATPLTVKLASGLHKVEAICEGDTLRKDFVVFSMSDKHPATVTHDWYYLSAEQFPSDGKPVYLQVGSSDEDTQIYWTVFSGDKVIDKGFNHISNEVYTKKINYKKSFGDGITITQAWVVRGKLYQYVSTIKRPLPDTKLKLTWKTFRDKLTPGQKETWTLNIVSPSGKPAKAQLISTMYDKSLDAITPHSWSLSNNYYLSLPGARWNGGSNAAIGLYGFQPYTSFRERELRFTHWDSDMFGWNNKLVEEILSSVRVRGSRLKENAQVLMVAPMAMAESKIAGLSEMNSLQNSADMDGASEVNVKVENVQASLRENLNETAFFYPSLTTDKNGNVNISFTLPESVTTWRFMGVAHDSLMNSNVITAEAVASKPVMVQPNMPRFLREGDKATISARIFNKTDRTRSGLAKLLIIDPETERVIMERRQTFAVQPNATLTTNFKVDAAELARRAKGQTLFVARVIADGNGFSDGEQHYLPLLPDMERVITTIPFYQNEAGVRDIDLSKLFPTDSKGQKLTIEYTNNPSWLVVQALPTIANPWQKNAASLVAAIYANVIGRNILTSSPKIAQTIKLWQQEKYDESSLTSNLSKNEDLKTMVLDETPWVAEADHESDQKLQLAQYLNESTIDYRVNDFTSKLRALQHSDGSFSWWPGMSGSSYMTMTVAETIARLNTLAGKQETLQVMLERAMRYLDGVIGKEVRELKKEEKKGVKNLRPSELACNWLYTSALEHRDKTSDMTYLVNLLDKLPAELTIYGKARTSVILAQYGKIQHAREQLESIRQYTVYKDEMGRYFDTHKAQYSWCDYRIPTQTAAIEALQMLETKDSVTIQQMQRWLLHEKRTTSWSTSINTVDAVYVFLSGNKSSIINNVEPATISLDGAILEQPKATAGIGYVKMSKDINNPHTLTVNKTSNGTSWGAVYGQYLQKATKVASASSGLSIKREIVSGSKSDVKTVGDKIVVRLTITADRDYDFIQVQDKRAACLEPAEQLSGYRWGKNGGYYCAPQDNTTNYYFDKLSKGSHVIETTYYIDRSGDYSSGICTVQCAYAPEFSARQAAQKLTVK